MSDLRDWLRRNKFEQYADAFVANDIDLDILPELSEHDLEQLGVSPGNRRRLLKAIAERSAEVAQSKPADESGSGAAEIGNATAVGPLPQYYLGPAAEVLLAAARPAEGLAHLDRAIAGIDEPGVGFYLPEIYRLRGACLLALSRGNKEEARSAFATARDIARRQGATIFERRAEASLSEFAG
jgi:tetratricopeptide (TPR) repeat protein